MMPRVVAVLSALLLTAEHPVQAQAEATGDHGHQHVGFVDSRADEGAGSNPELVRYLEEVIGIVDKEWKRILAAASDRPLAGSRVSIQFVLNSDGEISRIEHIEENAGRAGTTACLSALRNPQPFRPWTVEMIEDLGREQVITFRFVYQ